MKYIYYSELILQFVLLIISIKEKNYSEALGWSVACIWLIAFIGVIKIESNYRRIKRKAVKGI